MPEVSRDSLLASVIREFGMSVEFGDTLARIGVGSELLAFLVDKDAISGGAPSELVLAVSYVDKRDVDGVICRCSLEGKDGEFMFLMDSDGRFALQQGGDTLFDSSRDEVMLYLDVDMEASPADVDEVLPEIPDDIFVSFDKIDGILERALDSKDIRLDPLEIDEIDDAEFDI